MQIEILQTHTTKIRAGDPTATRHDRSDATRLRRCPRTSGDHLLLAGGRRRAPRQGRAGVGRTRRRDRHRGPSGPDDRGRPRGRAEQLRLIPAARRAPRPGSRDDNGRPRAAAGWWRSRPRRAEETRWTRLRRGGPAGPRAEHGITQRQGRYASSASPSATALRAALDVEPRMPRDRRFAVAGQTPATRDGPTGPPDPVHRPARE